MNVTVVRPLGSAAGRLHRGSLQPDFQTSVSCPS